MEEIVVCYCDVNPSIKDSRVFQDLINHEEENESITLQKRFYFADLEELFKSSFSEILNVMRFWNINPLPYQVLNYFYENKEKFVDLDLDEDLVNYFEEISVIIELNNVLLKEWMENEWDGDEWKIDSTKNFLYIKAVEIGSLNLLKIAHIGGFSSNIDTFYQEEDICMYAAANGHLDCLKYLHENNFYWNALTCNGAAKNGHLDCLMYALENGCRWDESTCMYAARNGYLDCVMYAHKKGCPFHTWICSAAASVGHLNILIYLHQNDCSWDDYTCKSAAKNGYLDCLMYAIKNGCPYNKEDCLKVAKGECKQYILDN